ncbi:hypothetical protein MFUL124B02_19060 [Myxococcus fulvus 124B02]|nr:hypothetical protein MFUL124B02_19060 [Myxococcus fulvus 124B02]
MARIGDEFLLLLWGDAELRAAGLFRGTAWTQE